MISQDKKKEKVNEYLKKMGISTSCSGYKVLFNAIIIASLKPELSCAEIFDEVANDMYGVDASADQKKTCYRNAYYAIKHCKNVHYEGGPLNFIKDCSIELE